MIAERKLNMEQKTKKLVGVGLLTAIVVVLQALAVVIRPTGIFNISLVLVPMFRALSSLYLQRVPLQDW